MTEHTPQPSRLALKFKARREELNLTQEDVASRVSLLLPFPKKLTQQVYAAFEKGKSQTTKHAMKIAQVLQIPLDALDDHGEGTQNFPSRTSEISNAKLIDSPITIWEDEPPLENEVEVPLLKEIELSEGSGRTEIREHGKAKIGFSKEALLRAGVEPENVVCITASGNSMEPVIPDGGLAGVDKGRTTVKDGDIFAIIQNNQLRIKILYRLPRGGLRMRSFNRDEHPDEEYPEDEIQTEGIVILGRIFWYSVLR
ncbi:helix-turn-helix domain-containing protein [Pseudomonas sp. FSL R10-0765]|uniref:Putative Cro/CI transcriptional regulator n=1 Tax=uncultured Caudovirales phage TaxID=2100421 RepID=A0A2H4J8A8_9CAUD|nr:MULTISPECIES: S24 family peptidase [unclassified Pseudomonas]ASN71490.1 putative Cro/CI transcriptional regulator [uncultured Caudovirales phage]MDU7558170.1 S24 family peptidase [Pseudomonas sp.]MQT42655.1 helix-turn-helix domain-containing protein [Pseudomonas sp. FSL R10-0765]MQU03430.1 helix-turn-helix domain-containing protein [Pseudomonas sp. FSL R10-2245]